jgi:hypothetical protein
MTTAGVAVSTMRLVGALVVVALGVVPSVLLGHADNDLVNASLAYVGVAVAVSLVVGTARAESARWIRWVTLVLAAVGMVQWALWSLVMTFRLLSG